MANRCDLTGLGPIVKNLVSHSHHKTKKWMKPNLHKRRLFSEITGGFVSLRVSTSALRSIQQAGGLDIFVLKQPTEKLSKKARALQTRIRKSRSN